MNACLAGTVWQREDSRKVWVLSDYTHACGSPGRVITFRSEGSPEEKITTVNRLLRHCLPYDSSAQNIYESEDADYGNDGAGNGRMRFDTNFTGTLWRNSQSNKVVRVVADPAASSGNERRRLVVMVMQGDATGREHLSSPARLHHAYVPACPRAVQISNGTVSG